MTQNSVNGLSNDAKWRRNWSPYFPRNTMLCYSQEGDMVLDQFVGETLFESKLLNRNIVGVDDNDEALLRWCEKVSFEYESDKGKESIKVIFLNNIIDQVIEVVNAEIF